LPASFDPALTAKLVSGLLTPAYPAYAKPVAIPGTMRLEAPPGEAPSEITVLDAALLAARASEAIRLVRVASRSADDGSTVYFDMSLPDALPAARKASTWTCEPPMRDAYGVTPRALPGGALELEFQPPRDLGTLWSPPSTRIRVEPGETVLFALAGPLLRVPKPDSTQILRPTYPTTAEEPVETRVLLVLSPRLEP
jgi:hypothetical protein